MYDWVIGLIDWGGYAGVFLLMLLETVFPPLPSEVILPLAGMRAADGPLGLGGVIAAATAGAMVGNFLWYLLARAVSFERFHFFIDNYGRWLGLDWDDVERVQRLFHRFGAGIVLVGRVLPAVRTFISVPAGLLKMRVVRYLIWSTIGTSLWSAALATGGYALGARFQRIEDVAAPVTTITIVAILLWYVWRQATWSRRRRPDQNHPGKGRN